MKTLQKSSHSSSRFGQPEASQKPKENYKDVQDAKFVELSDEQKDSTKESDS
jgi:hypothetical protein